LKPPHPAICHPVEAIMPLAKLTCPKCHATLKPAKPVPEGKLVKCPKCEETFKAGAKSADDKAATTAKKPAAAKSEPAEEQESETYAVLKDEGEERKKAEAEERERRKKRRRKRIEAGEEDPDDEDEEDEEDDVTSVYLKNLKATDPRGATQDTVVGPANWLLRTALLAFFGWVGYFVAFTLPIAFPNIERKEDVDQFGRVIKEEKKSEKKQAFRPWGAEGILHGFKTEKEEPDFQAWSIIIFVFVLILGLVQAGVIANASVKMQSLESYNWAMWGCIIAMIPLVTFPWFVFITYILDLADWLIELGLDDMCWMAGIAALVWGPIVGGICLKKFLEPQVKPGFEYKPD
jgi:hypothetical protein